MSMPNELKICFELVLVALSHKRRRRRAFHTSIFWSFFSAGGGEGSGRRAFFGLFYCVIEELLALNIVSTC